MSDQNVPITPAEPAANVPLNNLDAFASGVWGEEVTPPATPDPPASPAADGTQLPATPPATPDEEILNSDEWVKKEYGWESAEAGRKELEELRKLREAAQTPQEIKFANDEARRYYEAITAGKTDDLYDILHQQRQLSRLEKMTIANVGEAAEIIKTNLQFKYKDLTQEQIDRLYTRQYALPEKPQQLAGQEDVDYEIQLENWKRAVQEKEQDIIIDARIAKPELLKFKNELSLPDIPKPVQSTEPTPESLEKAKQDYDRFMSQLNNGYQNFKGFESKVKDESGEIPVTFNVPEEERNAIYTQLKDFNLMEFFDGRWFDKDGNANVNQMMSDLYLLQKSEKIFQGMNTNAANIRLENYLKAQNNIKLNGTTPQTVFQPNNKQLMDELANLAFSS